MWFWFAGGTMALITITAILGSALPAHNFKEAHEIDFCECGTLRRLQDMRDRLRSKPFLSIAAASGGYL
jgi:hypothetical protein